MWQRSSQASCHTPGQHSRQQQDRAAEVVRVRFGSGQTQSSAVLAHSEAAIAAADAASMRSPQPPGGAAQAGQHQRQPA